MVGVWHWNPFNVLEMVKLSYHKSDFALNILEELSHIIDVSFRVHLVLCVKVNAYLAG
jgi:hypothetical protein